MRPNERLFVTGGFFPGGKASRGVKFITHLNLLPKLTNGAGPATRLRGADSDKFTFIFTFYVPLKLRYTLIHNRGASN